jgi:hypothetical protein
MMAKQTAKGIILACQPAMSCTFHKMENMPTFQKGLSAHTNLVSEQRVTS